MSATAAVENDKAWLVNISEEVAAAAADLFWVATGEFAGGGTGICGDADSRVHRADRYGRSAEYRLPRDGPRSRG